MWCLNRLQSRILSFIYFFDPTMNSPHNLYHFIVTMHHISSVLFLKLSTVFLNHLIYGQCCQGYLDTIMHPSCADFIIPHWHPHYFLNAPSSPSPWCFGICYCSYLVYTPLDISMLLLTYFFQFFRYQSSFERELS